MERQPQQKIEDYLQGLAGNDFHPDYVRTFRDMLMAWGNGEQSVNGPPEGG